MTWASRVVLMPLGNNIPPALKKIAEFADRYPNVKIAMDHIGFPRPENLPETFGLTPEHMALAAHKNVYYKFTSFLISEMEAGAKTANKPMVELKPFVEHMVSVFGADHLCWGSDYGNVEVDDVALREARAGCRRRVVRRRTGRRSSMTPPSRCSCRAAAARRAPDVPPVLQGGSFRTRPPAFRLFQSVVRTSPIESTMMQPWLRPGRPCGLPHQTIASRSIGSGMRCMRASSASTTRTMPNG